MRTLVLAFLFAAACGGSKPATSNDPPTGAGSQTTRPLGDCVKAGCSGTLCGEPGDDTITTCEMKPEYACYQSAECKRQGDGKCAWTQTPELTKCLASPPAMDSHGGAPQ